MSKTSKAKAMAKYRKKPVEVEAVQFTGSNCDEITAFVGRALMWKTSSPPIACIPLRRGGELRLHAGAWLIREADDFDVRQGKVFEESYEPVIDANALPKTIPGVSLTFKLGSGDPGEPGEPGLVLHQDEIPTAAHNGEQGFTVFNNPLYDNLIAAAIAHTPLGRENAMKIRLWIDALRQEHRATHRTLRFELDQARITATAIKD